MTKIYPAAKKIIGRPISIRVGYKQGKLTLIQLERVKEKWEYTWKCDCGTIKKTSKKIALSKSCGCLRSKHLITVPGFRHGRLVIVEKLEREKNGKWVCRWKCDCGNERVGTYQKSIKSCGCLRKEVSAALVKGIHERWVENIKLKSWDEIRQAALNSYFTEYKREAKKRGINFFLKSDEFSNIVTKNCYYCNEPPRRLCHIKWLKYIKESDPYLQIQTGKPGTYKNLEPSSAATFSGIDRIDNNGNYEKNNVIPSCKWCNRLKSNLSIEEFWGYLKRMEFQVRKLVHKKLK